MGSSFLPSLYRSEKERVEHVWTQSSYVKDAFDGNQDQNDDDDDDDDIDVMMGMLILMLVVTIVGSTCSQFVFLDLANEGRTRKRAGRFVNFVDMIIRKSLNLDLHRFQWFTFYSRCVNL